jgi:hypothetical protein
MTKPKRRAEDLAQLIVKAAPLALPPYPFSAAAMPLEWAKLSAEIRRISKNDRRRQFALWSVVTFLATAAALGFLIWLEGDSFYWFPGILAFFSAWLSCLGLIMFVCAFCTRMFVQGFVEGLRFHEPGAPRKWTTAVCEETVAAVQAVAAETGLSVARSIDILKKRSPEQWQNLSEQRYYEALQRLRDPQARDTPGIFS